MSQPVAPLLFRQHLPTTDPSKLTDRELLLACGIRPARIPQLRVVDIQTKGGSSSPSAAPSSSPAAARSFDWFKLAVWSGMILVSTGIVAGTGMLAWGILRAVVRLVG